MYVCRFVFVVGEQKKKKKIFPTLHSLIVACICNQKSCIYLQLSPTSSNDTVHHQ